MLSQRKRYDHTLLWRLAFCLWLALVILSGVKGLQFYEGIALQVAISAAFVARETPKGNAEAVDAKSTPALANCTTNWVPSHSFQFSKVARPDFLSVQQQLLFHIQELLRSPSPFPPDGMGSVTTFQFPGPAIAKPKQDSIIPVLGVPVMNHGELLAKLLASIDVDVGELVLVWNVMRNALGLQWARNINETLHRDVLTFHRAHRITIHVVEGNSGVSTAWNAMVLQHQPANFTFVTSSDIVFYSGYLQFVVGYIQQRPMQNLFLPRIGFNFFALRHTLLEQVGPFDENIWPAYVEDCEYINRLLLTGWHHEDRIPGKEEVDFLHAQWSSTSKADPEHHRKVQVAQARNWQYVRRKWNFMSCGAKLGSKEHPRPFLYPFNNPNVSFATIVMDCAMRAKQVVLFQRDVIPAHFFI